MNDKPPSDKPTRLRSGVELPAGVPVIRAQLVITGPDLPPGSKFVGIRVEKSEPQSNVVPFKPKSKPP